MDNKHEVKLCECAICGNQYPLVRRRYVAQRKAIYAVQCQRCRVRTLWHNRKYKAIEAWNRGLTMRENTRSQIDSDYHRIKAYLNENEELENMCCNCENWCGKEHDYEECLDKPCFTFYRCYEYLDYLNTWR